MDDVRLSEWLSIAIHNAIAQVNPVTRDPDHALHQMQVRRLYREKDDNVAAPNRPVVLESGPAGWGSDVIRSTKTWSPISSVFSIELVGISNA